MGFKFLRHPCQFEYESLDNYLDRLADENAVHINWILDKFDLRSSTYPNNLSKVSTTIIQNLSQATGLSIQTIRNMTANGLSQSISDDIILNHSSKFCPLCLQEHHYPRVYWQFKLLDICDKHNSILISRCPNCNAAITTSEIIKGVCRCGKELKDIRPSYCNDQELLDFNKILYSAHNVGPNREHYFKDLTGSQFMVFIGSLLKLIQSNKEIVNHEWFIKNCEYERHSDLYQYQILCLILNNWPQKLYSILDDIFYSEEIENLYGFNPLYNFFVPIIDLPEYDFYKNALITYLKKRFNYTVFTKKYKHFLIKKDFLKANSVKTLFGIRSFYFKSYEFPSVEGHCVNVREIFNLFDIIISKIGLSNSIDTGYISLLELQSIFIEPNSNRLIDLIKRIKQPVNVSLFPRETLSLFSFSETEIYELLNETTRKLD
jgi:Uncharacterized protein conserved in bacteria